MAVCFTGWSLITTYKNQLKYIPLLLNKLNYSCKLAQTLKRAAGAFVQNTAFRKNSCGPAVIVGFWRENN